MTLGLSADRIVRAGFSHAARGTRRLRPRPRKHGDQAALRDRSRATDVFGRQCLLARRLVERGVRFVQLYHTSGGFQPWDQHSDLKGGHARNALATDLPIAGFAQRSESPRPAG